MNEIKYIQVIDQWYGKASSGRIIMLVAVLICLFAWGIVDVSNVKNWAGVGDKHARHTKATTLIILLSYHL